jgi:N-acetyl-gamma-glutamyl-phosphate reductase
MVTKRVFIDGEAGTTGLQIRERLANHNAIELVSIAPELRKDAQAKQEIMRHVDLVILCLHDEAAIESVKLIDAMVGDKPKILDASTAHRTDPNWVYGFAELNQEQGQKIQIAPRVSNPGCYATGAIALINPLIKCGLIDPHTPLCLPSVSGYSGGGRAMIEDFESSADPRYEAYALGLSHKHLPEIKKYAGLITTPLFVPCVANFRQGMLVQLPLHLSQIQNNKGARDIFEALQSHYSCVCDESSPVVSVHYGDPSTKLSATALAGSDNMALHVFANEQSHQAVLFAQFDNLGKGASGAATQNLKLMLGL